MVKKSEKYEYTVTARFNHELLQLLFICFGYPFNFTKWSNTLKQFVGKLPTNCLSVFDHFVGLVLKAFKKI